MYSQNTYLFKGAFIPYGVFIVDVVDVYYDSRNCICCIATYIRFSLYEFFTSSLWFPK